MDITVKIESSELVEAMNNLAVSITNIMAARADLRAETAAEKAIDKAAKKGKKPQPEVGENTGSNGSDQPAEKEALAPDTGVALLQTPPVTPSEAVAPISDVALKSSLMKLASAKSKVVGVETVRATISKFGGANINATSDDKLADLKVALEALA